jgi:hypothetical protein
MIRDDALDERQAEAAAARANALAAIELIEDSRDLLGRNSLAGVGDVDPDIPGFPGDADGEVPAGSAVLGGVVDQVVERSSAKSLVRSPPAVRIACS